MDTPKDLRLCCANCKWYAQKRCLMPDATFVGYCCKDNIKILKIFNEYFVVALLIEKSTIFNIEQSFDLASFSRYLGGRSGA